MRMKRDMITLALLAAFTTALAAGSLKLGNWYCVGPFKNEAFGNIDRTLQARFAPEQDYFKALGLAPDASESANLALRATASSPDDMRVQGHPLHRANDGNLMTYWDDADSGKLYVLRLDWKVPAK